MNKTLVSLSFLTYNWEEGKKDIIDSYTPLICSVIRDKNYDRAERNQLKQDLLNEFGINIPLGAVETILKRMVKEGLLKRTGGEFHVNYDKVCSQIKDDVKEEFLDSYQTVIDDLKIYAEENFDLNFTSEECEEGFIAFLKEYDIDLLFANREIESSVLPKVKESKKLKYIIANYIFNCSKNHVKKFNTILKLAKGHVIASLITYSDELETFKGSLENVLVFLDAPLIYNLIGLNGDSNLQLCKELVAEFQKHKAKLKIFTVNYNEVIKTIQDAINRLRSRNYDLRYGSRVLRTAVRENISASTLELKISQVDKILKDFNVERVEIPVYDNVKFQIDESKLTEIIKSLYQGEGQQEVPFYKNGQIENDVNSLSAIFRIRRDTLAVSLKNSKAVFITNNEQIAFAAKKYEKEDWQYRSSIPVCVTDIFISTILWANYPGTNDSLNTKRLMSECYSLIDLDPKILGKYYKDIEQLNKENKISPEQYHLLKASNLAYNLLEKKTLNDIEEYTDKTPAEILEDIQIKYQSEATSQRAINTKVNDNIKRISKAVARAIFVIVFVGLALIALILKFKSDWNFNNWVWEVLYYCVVAFIAIFGIFRWADLIPPRAKFEDLLSNKFYNLITRILHK